MTPKKNNCTEEGYQFVIGGAVVSKTRLTRADMLNSHVIKNKNL